MGISIAIKLYPAELEQESYPGHGRLIKRVMRSATVAVWVLRLLGAGFLVC